MPFAIHLIQRDLFWNAKRKVYGSQKKELGKKMSKAYRDLVREAA